MAGEKPSSLFDPFVSHEEKKFYNIDLCSVGEKELFAPGPQGPVL